MARVADFRRIGADRIQVTHNDRVYTVIILSDDLDTPELDVLHDIAERLLAAFTPPPESEQTIDNTDTQGEEDSNGV